MCSWAQCLQAAALAEFRADWSTAVKTYQTAYAQVQKVQVGSALPFQHWYELTQVAEQVHIKVLLLLLLLLLFLLLLLHLLCGITVGKQMWSGQSRL